MAKTVKGSFSFTVLDEQNNLYFVRGDNPLCIIHYPKPGLYWYASTAQILMISYCLICSVGEPSFHTAVKVLLTEQMAL